ncbi:MAG: DUF5615 family PIN-like protein [Acidimicrobiales bacterium]
MRLIVDANLAPGVARRLREAGHDPIHVFDVGLGTASDEAILAAASRDHHRHHVRGCRFRHSAGYLRPDRALLGVAALGRPPQH